jgi:alpha-1,3-mannosyltransferase
MPLVTHVVRQFLPNRGGIEDVVMHLSLGLMKVGWDVRIVTLNRLFRALDTHLPRSETIGGLPVTRIPFRGSIRYPMAPRVLSCLGNSDIVHVHAIDFFYDFLALTRPLHRKKLFITTHGGFFHTDFAARLKRMYFATATRLSALAYDRIVASSEHDAELFRQITSRVVTIETGVGVEKFANCAAGKATRTIIYFGRLSKNKRLPTLIAFLAALRKISSDWSLIIAGTEFDESFCGLAKRARSLGVENAVRFFVSPTDTDLAGLIRSASYFASLSAYEGFGISVVEAMSAGLVPILSDIRPFREFIRRAGTGILVDVCDLETAAEAVAVFDETPPAERRDELISAAAEYSWSRMTNAYLCEYKGALAGN